MDGLLIMETPINMDDLGYLHFRKPPYVPIDSASQFPGESSFSAQKLKATIHGWYAMICNDFKEASNVTKDQVHPKIQPARSRCVSSLIGS